MMNGTRKLSLAMSRPVLAVLLLWLFCSMPSVMAAEGASLYLEPDTKTVETGETLSVEIRLRTDNQPVNVVQAELRYPKERMKFVRFDEAGSSFDVQAETQTNEGTISITRGTTQPQRGDVFVARMVFEVLGTAQPSKVVFTDQVAAIDSETHQNILTATTGGSYSAPEAPSEQPDTSTVEPGVGNTPGGSDPRQPGGQTSSGQAGGAGAVDPEEKSFLRSIPGVAETRENLGVESDGVALAVLAAPVLAVLSIAAAVIHAPTRRKLIERFSGVPVRFDDPEAVATERTADEDVIDKSPLAPQTVYPDDRQHKE